MCGLALADGTLSGVVFDVDGAPAPGAMVQVIGPEQRMATADDQGHFALDLPAGTWTVRVDGIDYAVRIEDDQTTEALITRGGGVVLEEPAAAVVVEQVDASPGTVRGVVVHAETGATLAGARVFVRGLDAEAVTDAQGAFELTLPGGERDLSVLLSGYNTEIVVVDVQAGETVDQQIAMVPAGLMLADFDVVAPRVEGGTAALLEERQESASVTEVLGAEEMSRAGDSDAASALSRVTGLTVVGGRYVYVRGLGDRYAATTLNGSALPSPEPERRVVPLDLFPASSLDSVVIQKTMSPDAPAEFGGGVVQLRTRGMPSEPFFSVGLSGTYRHGTTFQEGFTGTGGPTDWLGLDNGFRSLPAELDAASRDSQLVLGDRFSDGYSAQELEAFGEMVPNRWSMMARDLPPNLGVDVSGGWVRSLGQDRRVGFVAGVDYGQSWQLIESNTKVLVASENGLETGSEWDFVEVNRGVSLGALAGAGLEWDNHELRVTSFLSRDTSSQAAVGEGFYRSEAGIFRFNQLGWVERQLWFNQVAGTHQVGQGAHAPTVDWRYAYSLATRLEPDRRTWAQEQTEDGWSLSTRSFGNAMLFSELDDRTHDLGLDVAVPVNERFGVQVKLGGAMMFKDRAVDTRRFRYFDKFSGDTGGVLSGPSSGYFTPDTIRADGFQLEDNTQATDNYTALQRLRSAYVLAEGGHGPVRAMVGVRMEQNRQQVSTFARFDADAEPELARAQKLDVLPVASVTWTLRDGMQLRGAYYRTVSRPEFREMSPATFYDVKSAREIRGNSEVERAIIDHADLRWELYPQPGESVSVGVFYKRFHAPIESVIVPGASNTLTYVNAVRADNIGLEVEGRRSLRRAPDFYVAGNASLVRSRVVLPPGGVQTSSERALQGQSPWVLNGQIGYDNPDSGSRVAVLYNVFGPRIVSVGSAGRPDEYEQPVHRLDVVASQELPAGFTVKVKGSNLVNSPRRVTAGGEEVSTYREGWSLGVGVSWAF
jgi:hypothetical protein